MRIRFGNAMLYGLLGFLVVSAGCRHQVATQTPPAPAVTPPPAQPTVTLQASRNDISRGQSVTLRWSATNATSVRVAPEVGSVAAEGATSVTPNQSTTYTATAIGPGGSATASARVTVSVPPPVAAATPQPTLEELFTKEVRDAFFDYDKANIRDDARSALSKTAEFLRSYPQVAIVIEGHCDERGSTEYNVALGDRRSDAAKDFLTGQGVASERIQTVSYGKERPFCTQSNEDCWQQNRRAHFRMTGTSSSQLSGN
ncbi:MAG: peptidoglycan-associated lipoprotein Pal [Acidobacteria bacterium]|nr:MAG: peptidoglycan-associated lipoprotein Pal [Acidobacteriota bacterium]